MVLMVIDGVGKRDQNRANTHSCEFRNCQRTRTANHQIGPGVYRWHVIDEIQHFGLHLRITIMLLTGL